MPPPAQEAAALAMIAWQPAQDVKTAQDGCTIGDPFACLALAELKLSQTTENKNGLPHEYYFQRAYGMLVVRCHKREPDACVAIARMYRLGRAARKEADAVQALLSRSRDLCRSRPGRVCDTLR